MEHFCTEHNCKFYENHKGDKTWWAHKISTGGYCNEKKAEPKPEVQPEIEKGAPEKPKIKEPDYKSPINRSVAISYAKDLCVAGKIELKELPSYADKFLAYIEKGD